jgi:hypothetical protein
VSSPFAYRAFGLNILSGLELFELPISAVAPESIDLHIELVDAVVTDMPPEAEDAFVATASGACVLRVLDTADYLVDAGASIRMALHPQGDLGMAKLYLLGSALGLALHQRGLLVMHASGVLHSGRVTMFVGDSGAGKSTLAAELARSGRGVLADDLLAVDLAEPGRPMVWPGARSFKLWADTLDALGLEKEESRQVSNRLDKYFTLNPRTLADAPYPLAEIMVLDTCEAGDAATVEIMASLQAVSAVSTFTYRPEFVGLLGRQAEHFRQCATLASQVTVRRFRRPWDPARIRSSVELLERLSS